MITEFIKSLHLFNDLFLSLYVFLFPKKYDIFYVVYIFIMGLHWLLCKNECIISYLEKKSINKNYILGSLPYHLPHVQDTGLTFRFYINILVLFNVFTIIYRSFDNKIILSFATLFLIIRFITSSLN